MSLENFQLIDDTSIDNSIIKRHYWKIYHQRCTQLNDSNQGFDFNFDENNTYHQIGNGYLEFDITLRKTEMTSLILMEMAILLNLLDLLISIRLCFQCGNNLLDRS